MERHRGDVRWNEVMAAVGPWITAEVNRDRKRHRKPFSLSEWTVSGLMKKGRTKRKVPPTQADFQQRFSATMMALGGKPDGDSRR